MPHKIMTLEEIKTLLPWLIGVVSTIVAVKKDWIAAQFSKKSNETALAASEEDVESKALDNVEKTVAIYQRMLDDMEKRFTTQMEALNLKVEALERRNEELDKLVEEQKEFIQKQRRSLKYYKDKFGDPKQ